MTVEYVEESKRGMDTAVNLLYNINSSINDQQNESIKLSNGLSNRMIILQELKQILKALTLDPEMHRALLSDHIDDDFISAYLQLDHVLKSASAMQSGGIKAASEVLIDGGKIIAQANSTLFQYMMNNLKSFGKDFSNLSILQNTIFLKLSQIYELLSKYDGAKAEKFKKLYISIAQDYYYSTYSKACLQVSIKKCVPLPPTPLIGDVKQSGALDKITEGFKRVFSLKNSRDEIINTSSNVSLDQGIERSEMVDIFSAISSQVFNLLTNEEYFAIQFFHFETGSESVRDYIKLLFDRSCKSFYKRLQEKFVICGNLVEILQLIDLLQEDKIENESEQKSISYLQETREKYLKYLYCRADHLLLEQVKSLDTAIHQLEPTQTVSIVCRRYADFVIQTIKLVNPQSEIFTEIFQKLLQAMDKFLSRTAVSLVNSRSQSVFLINNYDYLVNYFENFCSRGLKPAYLSELIQNYENKLSTIVNGFVAEDLRPYFVKLFDWIECYELGQESDLTEEMVIDFNQNCASRLRAIHGSVIQLFSSYRTSIFVMNVLYTKVLSAYTQLIEIHDKIHGKKGRDETITVPISINELESIIKKTQKDYVGSAIGNTRIS